MPGLGSLDYKAYDLLDANRERTLKSLDMDQLLGRIEGSGPQADVALGVLYNLCLDYGIYDQLVSSFCSHIWQSQHSKPREHMVFI